MLPAGISCLKTMITSSKLRLFSSGMNSSAMELGLQAQQRLCRLRWRPLQAMRQMTHLLRVLECAT